MNSYQMLKQMKACKIFALVPLMLLCSLAQPALAQSEAYINLKKETQELERKVAEAKKIIETLTQKDEPIVDSVDIYEKRIAEIKKQRENVKDSASSKVFDKLYKEVAELKKLNTFLEARSEELKLERQTKTIALEDLKKSMAQMEGLIKRQYEENITTMTKRYSTINDATVSEIVATLNQYEKQEGFDDYKLRVANLEAKKQLYNRSIEALNSVFDADNIRDIRKELKVVLTARHDNPATGDFKLTEAQFSEVDSLDIRLSRYQVGLRRLKELVEKVNSDGDIKTYRNNRKKNKTAETKNYENTLESILESNDAASIEVRKKYFEMVPFLGRLLGDYLQELKQSPYNVPTPTEERIINMSK